MRGLKIIGVIAAALVLAGGIAVGLALTNEAHITRWAIEHPISSYIGRKVTITGPLSVHWGSPTRLHFAHLKIANAPWGKPPDMFDSGAVDIQFYPTSLWRGAKDFPLISVDHARLHLETSPGGERNWSFVDKLLSHNARGKFPILKKLVANDGEITFHNGTSGATNVLAIRHAELDAPDPRSQVRLAFDGSLQGERLHIAGMVGPLADLRNPASPYPVDLAGSFGPSRLLIQGTAQKPLAFSGLDLRLSLDGKGLQKLAAALDIPLPPLPDFRATGVLTGGAGDWILKALSTRLGASDLEGGVEVDLRGKLPYLRANLTSSYIDLADFIGFLGTKPAHSSAAPPLTRTDASERILSATPIAASRLSEINADVGLEAGRVKGSKGLPLERVSAALHLENGVLDIKPLDFGIGGGSVDFALRLDAKERPPELKLDLGIRRVDLHRLVEGMALSPLLKKTAGTVGGFLHFTSTGSSLRDFLGHMNGRAALFAQNGRLSQLLQELVDQDVLDALGLLITGDQPSRVNCLVSDFVLRHGVATAKTAVLDTPATLVVGDGNANFASETLFFDLKPYDKNPTLLTLHAPVDLRGTFAHPSISISSARIAREVAEGVVLGLLLPPLGELLPFIDIGLGDDNACRQAFSLVNAPAGAAARSAHAR